MYLALRVGLYAHVSDSSLACFPEPFRDIDGLALSSISNFWGIEQLYLLWIKIDCPHLYARTTPEHGKMAG